MSRPRAQRKHSWQPVPPAEAPGAATSPEHTTAASLDTELQALVEPLLLERSLSEPSTLERSLATRLPRRRALIVGINYTGTSSQLSGCVNDAHDVYNVCHTLGYGEIAVLHDGYWPGVTLPQGLPDAAHPQLNSVTRPTLANLKAGVAWLIADAAAGDLLFFHYSGHGGQLAARVAGTQPNDLNDTLVPLDYTTAGQLRDEDLKRLLVEPLRGKGATLRIVLDCCHSGTGVDLRYNLLDATSLWSMARTLAGSPATIKNAHAAASTAAHAAASRTAADPVAEAGAAVAAADAEAADGPEIFLEWEAGAARRPIMGRAFARRPTPRGSGPAEVCMISGCADPQTSADAYFSNRASGALTHFLLAFLGERYRVIGGELQAAWPTAVELLRGVRRAVRAAGFDQVPQFSSEEPITPATRFNLT